MPDYHPLWDGGPLFAPAGPFPLSTDSVLLAHFVRIGPARRGVDLGCGSGILPLLLLTRSEKLHMTGLELMPEVAAQAEKNLSVNGLGERSAVLRGDLREYRSLFPAGSFDLVTANPPYFPADRGLLPPEEGRARARGEVTASLEEVCAAAAWLCRSGGSFSLVHRPERLSELFVCLTAYGLEPKRFRLVCHRPDAAPCLVLVEARRGGRPGLHAEPCLFLRGADGNETAEYKVAYHIN